MKGLYPQIHFEIVKCIEVKFYYVLDLKQKRLSVIMESLFNFKFQPQIHRLTKV